MATGAMGDLQNRTTKATPGSSRGIYLTILSACQTIEHRVVRSYFSGIGMGS